jgi:hypothetical protein
MAVAVTVTVKDVHEVLAFVTVKVTVTVRVTVR